MNTSNDSNGDFTLDPPGSIAIVGAGTHGIEAGIYGRFLGYNVTILEQGSIGNHLLKDSHEELAVLPNQCLSSLGLSAIEAQREAGNPESIPFVHPTTVSEWVSAGLVPLSQTDLLNGRVKTGHRVQNIDAIDIEPEDDMDTSDDFAADFVLHYVDSEGNDGELRAEAVVIATGDECDIKFSFPVPCPYLYRIESSLSHGTCNLIAERRQIVKIYSSLGGRHDLDLYRPPRV